MKKRNKTGKTGNMSKTFKNAVHKHNPAGTKIYRLINSNAVTLRSGYRLFDAVDE